MNESISKYVKLGIIHFMVYPQTIKGEGPILETLKRIAIDPYFQVVELSWIKDKEIRKKAKEMLEQAHIEVKYGAQPRLLTQKLDLNSFDENERRRAIDTIKEGVDEAKEVGATSLALLSGRWVDDETKREKALDLLIDSLKEICAYSDGFPIALEQFDFSIDKRALVGPVKETLRVCQEVKKEYKNFGLLVDLSHLPLLGLTPHEDLEPLAEFISHVHIGNCMLKEKEHAAYGDKHPRLGIAGGENDVEQLVDFLRELFSIGYLDGKEPKVVSFEVSPTVGEDPEIVIANSKRVLDRAWSIV